MPPHIRVLVPSGEVNMGVPNVAKQLLARSGRAALVPILLAMVGGFWLLSPVGAAPADVTDVSIDPSSDTNAVNTVHSMTATVTPAEADTGHE